MDNTKLRHMPYKLLHEITGGFSCMLGSGGFGKVYKGVDKDGQEIAVKMLHSTIDIDLRDKEFHKEMENIIKLRHPNIVQLLGFCMEVEKEPVLYKGEIVVAENRHRALCFQYMDNGSLQDYLSDPHQGLSWQQRYRIIKGICEGLKYLHTGLASPMCHLDLKPANILLDKKMTPKIADFGLSRLIGDENTRRTANPMGTLGYAPPEFMNHNITSKESDIYSFGVIIIMIMAGPTMYSFIGDKTQAEFSELVQTEWRKRLQETSAYMSFEADCEQVKKCIEIAFECRKERKQQRPTIEVIVDQLSQTEKYKIDQQSGTEKVATLEHKSTEIKPNAMHLLPINMQLRFLEEITNNFSPERQLGKGVWGTSYKGLLPDGREIVVRRFHENLPIVEKKLLENEIASLMGFQHENIVKLVGYCYESTKEVVVLNGRYVYADRLSCYICHEYLPMGSLDKYIFSESNRAFDWDTRFKIIMGICKGLRFLHGELATPIVHMDIRSDNILLDYNWVPKIGDFGFWKLVGLLPSRMHTVNVVGKRGHLAPEFIYRGEVSNMSDIYSLGILILEITTGEKCSIEGRAGHEFVQKVRQVWSEVDHASPKYSFLDAHGIQQAKACIEIGLQCVRIERRNRPSIVEIINKLNEIKEIKPISTELLDIYPPHLRFAYTPNKPVSRSIRLTNKSDDRVAVRLQSKGSKRYKMPLLGIVPPHSTYTLVVTTREQDKALPNDNESLTLESIIVREGDLTSMNLTDAKSAIREYDNIFKKARKTNARNVHELTLPVACVRPRAATSSPSADDQQPLLSEVEILSKDFSPVLSVDVHPKKPWIMTSHCGGNVVIWNYKTLETKNTFNVTKEPVYCTKFIEREGWFVAGDDSGIIHVYDYHIPEKAEKSIEDAHAGPITSLDVHPTARFMLSSSEDDDHPIKLWEWGEKGWRCSRTFAGHSDTVTQVIFIPTDANSFASASLDQTIRIWTISSSESIMTLCDHLEGMLCMHNYISNSRNYLISGFSDGSVQVWDVEEERCVETLKGHANRISCVYSDPKLPVVITGSDDGTVRVWNSTTYRLENIIGVNLGVVHALGYIESIRRLAIGCYQGIALVELNSALDGPATSKGQQS